MHLNEAAEADGDDDLLASLSEAYDSSVADDDGPELEAPGEPEETPEDRADRSRDEKGRFAAKAEKAVPEATEKPVAAPAAEGAKDAEPAPGATAAQPVRPPPGWSPAAKAAFAGAPKEIQEAVARREVEVNQGFAKLAEYKPIERFAEMARQSGTTLDRALEGYVGIENALRTDFIGGIGTLCRNYGIEPTALAQAILTRSGAPAGATDQATAGGVPPAPPAVNLQPVVSRIEQIERMFQQQQQQAIDSEIAAFASKPEHLYYENVRIDMGHLINANPKLSLEEAYDKAAWANPEIRALLIKQQTAPSTPTAKAAVASKARAAAKSITGSPSANGRASEPDKAIEDLLSEAWDAQMGRV